MSGYTIRLTRKSQKKSPPKKNPPQKTKKINNAANKSSASDSIQKKNLRDRVFIVRLSKTIDFLTHGFRNLENQLC